MTYQEELEQANRDLSDEINEINEELTKLHNQDNEVEHNIERLKEELERLKEKIKFKNLIIEIFGIHYQQLLLLTNKKYGAKYFILEINEYIQEVEFQAKTILSKTMTLEELYRTIKKSYLEVKKNV